MRRTALAAVELIDKAHARDPRLGYFLLFAALAYVLAILTAGFMSLAYYFSLFGTAIIFAALLAFRWALPFAVIAFVGAWQAWGWHWPAAALFAAPLALAALREHDLRLAAGLARRLHPRSGP